MSKAVMYGMNKTYIPNNRADARRHRKAYQHGRSSKRDPWQKKAEQQKGDVNDGSK